MDWVYTVYGWGQPVGLLASDAGRSQSVTGAGSGLWRAVVRRGAGVPTRTPAVQGEAFRDSEPPTSRFPLGGREGEKPPRRGGWEGDLHENGSEATYTHKQNRPCFTPQ
jgi:hypothetical protein